MKFVGRSSDRIWQVRHRECQINTIKISILTTVLVKQPAFFVVRLMPQEGTAWGVEFEIHGSREWQKMAGQEQQVPIKKLSTQKFATLTTGVVDRPAIFIV